ncbi:MAG: AbrB/MazE/SpoVT family DNA-binding domain-containing protein [Verrucomicrobia bacterium]|nr:AbrB/MazE/SpoVT family DNA-binding domain-containing protein [Verrucomicrobiota bacterium]
MTATVNRRGQIVLRTTVQEKVNVKSGDVLVVLHDQAGRIVLQKRRAALTQARGGKSYLTPPPLPPAALERIYARPDREWDKIEAEATALSRRALTGKALEEL